MEEAIGNRQNNLYFNHPAVRARLISVACQAMAHPPQSSIAGETNAASRTKESVGPSRSPGLSIAVYRNTIVTRPENIKGCARDVHRSVGAAAVDESNRS